MVATPHQTVVRSSPAASRAKTSAANLNARIAAHVVDSVVLLGFLLGFLVIAGLILLLSSDLGAEDPPDWAYYAFVTALVGGSAIAWSALNVALLRLRGQTAGQYLMGIRVVSEGPALTVPRALLRWFGLHPLLYHPLFLPLWAFFGWAVFTPSQHRLLLVPPWGLAFLCAVAPVAGLVAMLLDPARRPLHDRLAGTMVISVDRR
jgi:hypothetical protein